MDFADDISVFANTKENIKSQTENLSRVIKTVGLKINAYKRKIVRMTAGYSREIKI